MFKSNRGQLSIFLGITLVIVMGMLAFIINVGLFVKAKINLQNAVDAAAFSGAAVQARQLTNIAYLNWEMRNNYKEWLFKYYVLGQLSSLRTSRDTANPFHLAKSLAPGSQKVDFTLRSLGAVSGIEIGGLGSTGRAYDHYNLPSICMHNSSADDICPSFVVPGLPRFQAIGIAGVSQIHEATVTALVSDKEANCAHRSREDFNAALIWAFGDGKMDPANPQPALLAADRPGAWPRAIELAMRMRNLEMIVNLPPHNGPITYGNAYNFATLPGANFAYHERPYKAFISAFKNLGGGKYKDSAGNGGKDELSSNFKLFELEPRSHDVLPEDLSGFLIPAGKDALKKRYLDLQAVPLNLATMFTSFIPTTNESPDGMSSEGTCGISKTAMPVPGFIIGFIKNPQVMTYYAVKGESKFIGIFSPFKDTSPGGITLSAYSAAKPFGGRIGPKLFDFNNENNLIKVRDNDRPNNRSLPYIYGLQFHPSQTTFSAGSPIPISRDFWINSGATTNANLGGMPASSASHVYFGIPNMIYDYVNITQQMNGSAGSGGAGNVVVDVKFKLNDATLTNEKLGLYDPLQFNLLKKSLKPEIIDGTQPSYTSVDILNGIVKARRPTKYDAVNYLVPDYKQPPSVNKPNAIPFLTQLDPMHPRPSGTDEILRYKIFAPLTGDGLLYGSAGDIDTAVGAYLLNIESGVDVYLKALHDVSLAIMNNPNVNSDPNNPNSGRQANINAAVTVHAKALNPTNHTPDMLTVASCPPPDRNVDIASKFAYFFNQTLGAPAICNVKPLRAMMIDFIRAQIAGDMKMYFYTEYYTGTDLAIDQSNLLTAYYPGPRQGVALSTDNVNLIKSPLGLASTEYSAKRNYYSTKFFPLSSMVTDATPLPSASSEQGASLIEFIDTHPTGTANTGPINQIQKVEVNHKFYYDF